MVSRFGMLSLSIIPLFLFTAVVVLALRAVVIAITPPRRGVKVPSCEKCRYPVAGLTALACPECGADLRATGIITRPMEMRRRGSLFSAIAWYTVLCFFLMMVASYMAMFFVGMYATQTTTGVTTTATPTSSAYRAITIVQDFGSPTYLVTTTINLIDGTTRSLQIQGIGSGNMVAVTKDAAGTELARGPFDKLTVPQFFTSSGIETSDATVAAEATELKALLDACVASNAVPSPPAPGGNLRVVGSSYTGTPNNSALANGLAQLLAVAIPLLLWVFGIIYIIFRRKKLLREAESADKPILA